MTPRPTTSRFWAAGLILLHLGCTPETGGGAAVPVDTGLTDTSEPADSGGDTSTSGDSGIDTGPDSGDTAVDTDTGDTALDTDTGGCPEPFVAHADADADGYGDPATATEVCSLPEGWTTNAQDCDDTRADVYPGAPERCDAEDDDCDGDVDEDEAEDASTWFLDADGDGHGNAGIPHASCDLPPGYASAGDDCDDADPSVYPGAIEVCDPFGADENCDGLSNDDDPTVDVDSLTTWYADADVDGYGAVAVVACEAPAGHVALGGDCDDADPTVSPGAAEVCDAMDRDEDCDASADDADPSVDMATSSIFYADLDGDGYGDGAAALSACDAPAGYLSTPGDCDPADAAVSPGATEVCANGVDDDCDGFVDCELVLADAARVFTGAVAGDYAGYDLTSGDFDGDGLDDLVLTSTLHDAGGTNAGAVWLLAGGGTGDLSLSSATATIVGAAASDAAGYCAAGIGDIDGDGLDELVVGAVGEDSGGSGAGAAYLVKGALSGSATLAGAYAMLTGEGTDANAGSDCAAAGDVDGDGVGDFVVGAPRYDAYRGEAYLVTAVSAGTSTLGTTTARFSGEAAGDRLGGAVDGAGDVNGDGAGDIVFGAETADLAGDTSGGAYVFFGPRVGSFGATDADAVLEGEYAGDHAGDLVRGVGDLDSDGYDDLAIGAPLAGSDGLVHLVFGPPTSGTSSLGAAAGHIENDGAGLLGQERRLDAGDYNADGLLDLVVGDDATSNEGAFYIFRGPFSGTATTDDATVFLLGDEPSAYVGRVAFVGAQDGRAGSDLLVTGFGSDISATNAGAAWLFSLVDF